MLIFCFGVAFAFHPIMALWYCYSSLCGLHVRLCVLFIDPVLMTEKVSLTFAFLEVFFFYYSAMLLC
jgi:hypothetical protein